MDVCNTYKTNGGVWKTYRAKAKTDVSAMTQCGSHVAFPCHLLATPHGRELVNLGCSRHQSKKISILIRVLLIAQLCDCKHAPHMPTFLCGTAVFTLKKKTAALALDVLDYK